MMAERRLTIWKSSFATIRSAAFRKINQCRRALYLLATQTVISFFSPKRPVLDTRADASFFTPAFETLIASSGTA